MIHHLTIEAFHATQDTARALERLAADGSFAKSRVTLRSGGLTAAVAHYHGVATPQLVIVEDIADQDRMLANLTELAEVCVAGTRVVVIGQVNDIAVYRALMSQGVSDYLVAPVTEGQLAAAINAMFADPKAAPQGRLITFFGARGGVGSSSLAHNVAWTLARTEDVILLDLDLAFGTLGMAFNSDPRQTVGELMGEAERIDTQLLDRILVKADTRLQLLAAPAELRPYPPMEVETVDRLLDQARRMAPILVVDLPHLWAPWIAHALESADEAVIVATPDLPNLRDVKALLDGIGPRRGDKAGLRLVLNKMDGLRKSQLAAKDFEETLKLKPAAVLPFDPVFAEAANSGQMVGDFAKSHKINDAIGQLAQLVSGRAAAPRAARKPSEALASWLMRR